MGLDQRIKVYLENENKDNSNFKDYWFRKVNCLQGYMEDKYSIDNCQEKVISIHDIIRLKVITTTILHNKDNIGLAKQLLPTYQGFFFGSYNYDDWYYEDIREINQVTDEILQTKNIEKITYYCWY